ncbi:glutamine amidotransferase [Mesorhizobium sp. IMUNJ 23232]|uniref:glutamine amidotransferase n=1 Tax=Mesorhizobium sp. IMUNJ 23232 TaxID=3376064 RepID=UPI003796E950
MAGKVLIAGETWFTTSVHTKGFDSFTTTTFHEGYSFLKAALEASGHQVEIIENHVAPTNFPDSPEALSRYSTVILSDIGANTLLLHPNTWLRSDRSANKLHAIADYVKGGGGLIMVGGYLTFTGIEAKGCWKDTVVEACLPVRLMTTDDRQEHPEGIVGEIVKPDHPVLAGVDGALPALLGYNRTSLAPGAELLAKIDGDPLVAVTEAGKGRTAVFTSDCSPHWCPTDFVNWQGYRQLWSNLCAWTGRQ